jgi:hypothetical protein
MTDKMECVCLGPPHQRDIFALSIVVTGANSPAVTPHAEWIFLEALNTLKVSGRVGHYGLPRSSGSSEGRWVLRLRG